MESDPRRPARAEPSLDPGRVEFSHSTHADLCALARLLLADEHLAEDVVQDAWRIALEHRASPVLDPRRWLRAIVRKTASDRRRTMRRREQILAELARTTRELDNAGEDREAIRELIRAAIARLDEPYGRVLEMRFLEGRPIDAIARELGRRATTVRSQIRRGVALVRAEIDRRHVDRERWNAVLLLVATEGVSPAFHAGSYRPLQTSSTAAIWLATASGAALMLGITWAIGGRSGGLPLAPLTASHEPPAASVGEPSAPSTQTARAAITLPASGGAAAPAVLAAKPATTTRQLVVDVTRADGGAVENPTVLVGRVITRQRVVSAPRSPVVIDVAPDEIEMVLGDDAVHVVARAAGEGESMLATVLLSEAGRQITLSTRGPGQTVTLYVVDETGEGVAGARASLGPPGRVGRTEPEPGLFLTDRIAAARTDARGEATFEHVPRLRRLLRVVHSGFEDVAREVVVDETTHTIEVVLARGTTVRGRVTRPDGAPAAGARVHVEDLRRSLTSGHVRATTAGADGQFTLRGLSPGATSHVFVHDPAEPALFASAVVTPEPEDHGTEEVEFRLAPHSGLTVRIVDEQGAPVTGRRVNVFAATGFPSISLIETTGDDGVARFRHVPSIPLDVMVERSMGDALVLARGLRESAELVDLVCPTSPAERGSIVGVIVGFDGQPIESAQVLGWHDGEMFRVDLARDGSFRADGLLPGVFELHVSTPESGSFHVGSQRVTGSMRAEFGCRRLPAPVAVDLIWCVAPPSATAPWRVRFIPSSSGQRAIEACVLTDVGQSLVLLPGEYELVPMQPTSEVQPPQRFTVRTDVTRVLHQIDGR